MKKITLGNIELVDVREIWDKEDVDFTPWLAQEDNIQRLSLAIGIDLVVEAEEKEVGPFRADILCKNEATDEWVLIENQLEKTDHKHLGQLLTYATGLGAVSIVWIAKEFSEEHRATLDWLNKITDDKHNFFGVKIEILKIEDKMAPNFKVISQPNDWSTSISLAASKINNDNLTDTKLKYLEFHARVCNAIKEKGITRLKTRKPRPQAWHNYPIGTTAANLVHTWNSTKNFICVELYIAKDKSIIEEFSKDKEEIEKEIGEKLSWRPNPQKVSSKIVLQRNESYLEKEEEWQNYIDWIIEKLNKFHEVFEPRLKGLE
mgnify:CR=1 FL=1